MELFTKIFWQVVLIKVIKTAAQAALGTIGVSAVKFSSVDWATVGQVALLAAVVCVLMNIAQESYTSRKVVPEEAGYLAAREGAPDVDREPVRPTDEDLEDGNHLGAVIDIEDSKDSGARQAYLK